MISLFTLLLLFGLFPQTPVLSPHPDFIADHGTRFNQLNTAHGLSHNQVRTIFQDSWGYLWIGTSDGLNRYDGYNLRIFRHEPGNPGSLNDNMVSSLFEDSKGRLWVGTTQGALHLYHRENDTFEHYIFGSTIMDIAEDHQGQLWLGTWQGLHRFDPESLARTHYAAEPDYPDRLGEQRITRILIDGQNRLWIATANGLYKRNEQSDRFVRFLHADEQSGTQGVFIRDMQRTETGRFIMATAGEGVLVFHPDHGVEHRFRHDPGNPHSVHSDDLFRILRDCMGRYWVGGEDSGLSFFNHERHDFRYFQHETGNPHSLNANGISALYESRDHTLWVGTQNGGISYLHLQPDRFEHYEFESFNAQSLSHNQILSFAEGANGSVWIGTDGGGINRFDPETGVFAAYSTAQDDPGRRIHGNAVLAIAPDTQGDLWVGTYGSGVQRYSVTGDTMPRLSKNPIHPTLTPASDNIFTIHHHGHETWMAAQGFGLSVFDHNTQSYRHYQADRSSPGSLHSLYVQDIITDRQNRLWFATYGAGIARYDQERDAFVTYKPAKGNFPNTIAYALHEDARGILWVGTPSGLVRFDPKDDSYRVYNEVYGLGNAFINGILEDAHGTLWVSTNRGVSRFNTDSAEVQNFESDRGIRGNQLFSRSYFHDSHGYFYFGGSKGFIRFNPDDIRVDEFVAPVLITDFLIYNQPAGIGEGQPLEQHISLSDHITLPHDLSVLTFGFVSLNFDAQKNDRYAYMLEGLDPDWNHVGSRRTATYTNLSPGTYTFRVSVTNKDGFQVPSPTELRITITPPFWRTTWFYISLTGFLVALAVGVFQHRVYSIKKRSADLERLVRQRTNELEASNDKLKDTLNELRQTRDELVEKAHKAGMADLATSILHDVGNILNSVNVSTATISQIINHSRLEKLHKANAMLRAQLDDIETFVREDPKAKTLLTYLTRIDQHLADERQMLKSQIERLSDNVQVIMDVVAAQHTFLGTDRVEVELQLHEVAEKTLQMAGHSLLHDNIVVEKKLHETSPVYALRSKLTHVLVNLLKNAVQSIEEQNPDRKKLTVETGQDDRFVYLSVTDNGVGFRQNEQAHLFSHGYTTKKTGKGFGLHNCANYMREMNGYIQAHSNGIGKGATFTLKLPRSSEKPSTGVTTAEHRSPHN